MTRPLSLCLLLGVLLGAIAACGGPAIPPPPPPAPSPTVAAPPIASAPPLASAAPTASGAPVVPASPPPGRMLPVTRTEFGARLAALGIDLKNLPRLEALDAQKRRLVMDYIAEATGADCTDCHASEEDFKANTPRKAVARRMWNEWARGLTTADGGPVFCDSCHHGSLTVLDRRDSEKIGVWMKANFAKMVRKDKKQPQKCEACHGEPFNGDFLQSWEKATR